MDLTTQVASLWKHAKGKLELLKHLMGEKLTWKQAGLGRCYFCMVGYDDGKCSCEVKDCPLFQHMPYRDIKPKN